MGRRGPTPIPTPIKLLQGNPGRRPLNRREPKPRQDAPRCPSWLDDESKKKWHQTLPELRAMGVVTAVDGDLLANYCRAWVRWRRAEEFLEEHGDVMPVRDREGQIKYLRAAPQEAIARNLFLIINRLRQELGMSPSSRTRIQVEKPTAEADEFERFLASKTG